MRRMQAIFTNASAEQGSDLGVLVQSSRLTHSDKSPLHNPAFGPYRADALLAALDRLHVPAKHAQRPIDQTGVSG